MIKIALLKQIEHAMLYHNEFEDTLLNIEYSMNNISFCCRGKSLTNQSLTPNISLRDTPTLHLQNNIDDAGDLYGDDFVTVTRRMKNLSKCRKHFQKRYIQSIVQSIRM